MTLFFSEKLDFNNIYDLPISALNGDNVIKGSKKLSWFKGPSLLPLLESIEIAESEDNFILPVSLLKK